MLAERVNTNYPTRQTQSQGIAEAGPEAAELWPVQRQVLLIGGKGGQVRASCSSEAWRAAGGLAVAAVLICLLLYSCRQLANKADVSMKAGALGKREVGGGWWPADRNLC